MTTFSTANVPTNINTVEKLAAWVGLLLNTMNPTLGVIETDGQTAQKVSQVSFFRAADGSLRLTIRLSLPVREAYATSTTKFWEDVQEISNTAIPSGYTSN